MNKNRLEAFSDGVFAIVITLLILDVRIPKVEYAQLMPALAGTWPKISAYALSFVIVGVYWVSHHNIMHYMAKIDRTTLWLNMLLLLFVGFLPFPTSLMGEYPFTQIPVVTYGCTLLATNATGFIIWRHVSYKGRLLHPDVPAAIVRGINQNFIVVNSSYVLAIAVSFISVGASYIIYALVIGYVLFPKNFDCINAKGQRN